MKLRQILAAAIACFFTLNLTSLGATKSVTYTVASKTSVIVSGTAPDGSSATYSQTYANAAGQATAGNSMTLTLSGYVGTKITGLTLSMKSNSSKGAGSMSMTSGGATLASIADSNFNTANWHGSWSTAYVNVTPNVTATTIGNNTVVINIAASANSLYCESFTIAYEPPNTAPVATGTGSATTSVGVAATVDVSTFFNDPDGDSLTYTTDAGTISGSTLSYTPSSTGTTTITVTATDPSGASANTTVTITAIAGNVAPVISVPQNSYSTPVGGSDINFTVTATGTPVPTITATCTEGAYFVFEDGEFLFEPDTAGTYHFVFTATNTEGSDSATVTVSVKVTVPELTISNVADTMADASWTACDDVSTYTLQLATDNQFKEDVAGGEDVTLFSNPATSVTAPDGWTYNVDSKSSAYLVLITDEEYIVSQAVSTKGMASLSIGFRARTYGGTSGNSGMAKVEYSSDGGTTWSEVGTATASSTSLIQKTIDASACVGLDSVQFRWTAPYAVSGKGIGIDTLSLSGVTAAVPGSIIRSETVSGTLYSFASLTPETTYYARVRGDNDWSNVEEFITDAPAATVPVITVPQASYSTTLGGDDVSFTVMASGIPAPTLALPSSTASSGDYDFDPNDGYFVFTPSATGTFTFTFTATNTEGSDSATVAVIVTPPPVTVPELTISDVTDTAASASWTACDNVSSYTLQLASDSQFSAGTSDTILGEDFSAFDGASTTDLSDSLDNYTETDGWTGSKVYENRGYIKLGSSSANGHIITPSVSIPAGATLSFSIAKYGSDTGTVDVQLSVNDGEFESLLDSEIAPQATAQTYTISFAEAVSGAKIKFVSSSKRFYLDDVVLASAPVGGSLLLNTSVSGTSHSFTGLTPETTYYVRVKGDNDWSTVEEFTTTASPKPATSLIVF